MHHYLGRLRRSLSGEVAPDRHFFADKAHQLHAAARRMVRIVQDVDRWLGECGTTVEHSDADGTRFIGECTLPAGHEGTHEDDGTRQLVAARITGELRELADAVDRLSDHFGWNAPAVYHDLTGALGTIANSSDALANLAASLDTIGHRTTRLAGQIRAVTLEHDAPLPRGARLPCVPPPADPPLSAGL